MRTQHLRTELRLDQPTGEVFAFFSDPHNLESITPAWLRFRIERTTNARIEAGTEIDYRLRLRGVPLRWRSRITLWEPPYRFVDEQIAGPFRRWRHLHTFEWDGEATVVRDEVEWAALGGALVRRFLIAPDLERIFAHRARTLRALFAARAVAERR